jgi:7-keto-8-aminopelargonate synthetase-like enzyme
MLYVIPDELNDASIHVGVRLSIVSGRMFKHSGLGFLGRVLREVLYQGQP